jgi:CRISPR-associated endoribonuclease Cas6
LFLRLVEHAAPELAARLHGPAPAKPFTVSPLQGRFEPVRRPTGVKVRTMAGETYWMRFTTLCQEVFQPFVAAFLGDGRPSFCLRLQDAYFTVREVITTPSSETAWSGYTDWERLLREARPHSEITVRFYSPTTFRQGGINVVDPSPELVFGSWWAKWRAFAPADLLPMDGGTAGSFSDKRESDVVRRIRVSALAIRTRMMNFGSFKQVGIVGWVTYDLSQLSGEERWWMNVLADFAFYAGTGAKTTMGMGQTRRLWHYDEASEDTLRLNGTPGLGKDVFPGR